MPLVQAAHDHPMIEVTKDHQEADFVIHSVFGMNDGENADIRKPKDVKSDKVALLEWSDGSLVVPFINKEDYRAVFKRSFVTKADGVFDTVHATCGDNCYPFGYSIIAGFDGLKTSTIGDKSSRHIPLTCTLRQWTMPETREVHVRQVGSARNRVLWWLQRDNSLPEGSVTRSENLEDGFNSGLNLKPLGALLETSDTLSSSLEERLRTEEHRTIISPEYTSKLHDSLLAVTANPARYEGDHRFWEHIATGSAVLSDKMYTPLPFPMIPGKHYETFDIADKPGNEAAFHQKIQSMLGNAEKTRKMACEGFQHGMKYHRAINRLDYIVRTMAKISNGEDYPETGPELRKRIPLATNEEKLYVKKAKNFKYSDAPYSHTKSFASKKPL